MIQKDLLFQRILERRLNTFAGIGGLNECTFEKDNGAVAPLFHARSYVSHWKQMEAESIGLLFWGPPGTGKTFAAACIANAFVESEDPFAPSVIMTTLGMVLQRSLALSPQDREVYLQKLLGCSLLILDDFGMERQTEYANEQVYGLINGRCLSGKPMILTTNLTVQQLKNPQTMVQHRIYDRVLEMCVPVCFDGESLRREKAARRLQRYKALTDPS